MNYQLFEKTLVKPIKKTNLLLTFHKQANASLSSGIIYTLYNKNDEIIKIGYAKNRNEFLSCIYKKGYNLVDKRFGTEREYKLLSITLKEIGYISNPKQSKFDYSSELINHLSLLGWPIGYFSKSRKKKYSILKKCF